VLEEKLSNESPTRVESQLKRHPEIITLALASA
jgi:hypothetical protein